MTGFWISTALLIAVALATILWPLLRRGERTTATTASIVGVVLGLPLSTLLLYPVVGGWQPDYVAPAPKPVAESPAMPESVETAIEQLTARLEKQPDDLAGWLLLGRSFVSQQRFPEALEAYRQAYTLTAGKDPEAKLGYAEAMILVDQNTLVGEAGGLFEEVLKSLPNDPRALWYGGLAAAARGDAGTTIARWQKLLGLELPDRMRLIVQQQLAAMGGTADPAPPATGDDSASVSIRVEVEIAPELAGRLEGTPTLFLIARDPGRPGPPLAVIRRMGANLPMSLIMDDSNVMLPGATLASSPELAITARLALGGEAMATAGDLYGEARFRPGNGSGPLTIIIDSIVE